MGAVTQNTYSHGSGGGGLVRWFGRVVEQTLDERIAGIGDTQAVVEIYSQETISANLDIPSNITVIMKRGSVLTLAANVTLGINGVCICEGENHFVLSDASCWLIFGKHFDAPMAQMFSGNGLHHVRFGLGPELCTDPNMVDSSKWAGTASWTFSSGSFTHNTGNTTQLVNNGATVGNCFYWTCFYLSAVTAGYTTIRASNAENATHRANVAHWESSHYNPNVSTGGLAICPSTDFNGTITKGYMRQIIGSMNRELYPQWWGAKNGVDCSPAINAALQAAKGETSLDIGLGYGNTVLVPAGQYRLDSPIYQPKGAKLFGVGYKTVFVLSATFATGTVPNYASAKFDAGISEYNTGAYFMDNTYSGQNEYTSGDFTIDGKICPGGDLAGQGTVDFSLFYVFRNCSYQKFKPIQLRVNVNRRQSHLYCGSEQTTAGGLYGSDTGYNRSGCQFDSLSIINKSVAVNRRDVQWCTGGDAQLAFFRDVYASTGCTLAIFDTENTVKNFYSHPSASCPMYPTEYAATYVNSTTVTVTAQEAADSARFAVGSTCYYQANNHVWGTFTVASKSWNSSTGKTTIGANAGTPFPSDIIAVYSRDGGGVFSLEVATFDNRIEDGYYDVDSTARMPVMHIGINGTRTDGRVSAYHLYPHSNLSIPDQILAVWMVNGNRDAAANVTNRPDQIKISGNQASLYTTGERVCVKRQDGWTRGTIVSASYDGTTYTTLTTKEPLFRDVALGTQTIYLELMNPIFLLNQYGMSPDLLGA